MSSVDRFYGLCLLLLGLILLRFEPCSAIVLIFIGLTAVLERKKKNKRNNNRK